MNISLSQGSASLFSISGLHRLLIQTTDVNMWAITFSRLPQRVDFTPFFNASPPLSAGPAARRLSPPLPC